MGTIRQGRRGGAGPWVLLVIGVAALFAFPPFRHEAAILLQDVVAWTSGRRAPVATADRPVGAATPARAFRPTPGQLAAMTIVPVTRAAFAPESSAEGRIALNDDENVPVYSPYAGRVVRILARAGEEVKADQLLFTVEATDMVQAQNDYQTAINALAKAREQLKLNTIIADRQRALFQAKAAALKDYQSAQNDVISAESDRMTADAALEAVTNRLRILGKSDAEIAAFKTSGRMNAETEIRAPIAGTVVQRKLGLGQYLSASGDPQFVIGDLATVWLIANAREGEIPDLRVGQPITAKVDGFGNRAFSGRIDFIAASLDPATRRLAIRSDIANPDQALKPEMFARFTIVTGPARIGAAIAESAVVHESEGAHVWLLRPDGAIEARTVRLGRRAGDLVEVTDGLAAGERIVARGALFIDRSASGDRSS
ncbi:efflux RND transporter periplasmic adaptor subunit [Methylobacterium sp. J-077]|uniref:efflux RND transporter periplasmic adaptor subunit n=1 Tax=Methylobacterium sp. J-077 TaxID=2836656 RepID=UPI001FB8A377|nr:efflux RND transporter periplasmic adaptor subunit [Methylobacterium sp. J-077]MCJ2126332.1 efflux RND transporter periplasmic adaptor subunit [Methylobacterium sp. J-077]